jgi:hypothetical protein
LAKGITLADSLTQRWSCWSGALARFHGEPAWKKSNLMEERGMPPKIVCTVILTALAVVLTGAQARAQSEPPKIELGVHLTGIDLNEVFEVPGGVGGRFTYNFTRHLSFDAEINYFPKKDNFRCVPGTPFCFGNNRGRFGETQGLFGLKAGTRFEKFGVFAKARPGFMHFGGDQITPDFNNQSRVRFAFDVGVVVEAYVTRRLAFRFDLGDTIIPFGGRTVNGINGPVPLPTGLHNFQGGAGLTIRF